MNGSVIQASMQGLYLIALIQFTWNQCSSNNQMVKLNVIKIRFTPPIQKRIYNVMGGNLLAEKTLNSGGKPGNTKPKGVPYCISPCNPKGTVR